MADAEEAGLGQPGCTVTAADERAVRLFASMDASAFTARHAVLYGTLVFFHIFDGYDLLMTGSVLPGIVGTFKLKPVQAGFFASSVFLGMLIGAVLFTVLADRIGRKKALFLAIIWYAVLNLAAAAAPSYHVLVLIRIIEGIGLGAEIPIVVTYVAEFTPARKRGLLSASTIFFWLLSGSIATFAAIFIIPLLTWRGMFLVGAIPAVFLIFAWPIVPESIRYLIRRNRIDEAEATVRTFSTLDPATVNPPDLSHRLQAVALSRQPARILDILRGRYLRYTLALWSVNFGMAVIFMGLGSWLPSIFMRMGYTVVHSLAFTAVIALSGAIGCLCHALVIDKLGRRATIGLSLLIGGFAVLAWGEATSFSAILGFGALTAFTGGGGVSGSVFTYNVELYPTQLRATGAGLATAWQRIGGIVAPMVLGILFDRNLPLFSSFAFFGALMLINGVIALTLLYETKQKSLEQITMELTGEGRRYGKAA